MTKKTLSKIFEKSSYLLFGVIFAVVVIILSLSFYYEPQAASDKPIISNFKENSNAKAELELFVMSQCPYGTAAENELFKVLKTFGNELSFKLYFIAFEQNGEFQSLHGEQEVSEDLRQICMIKHAPEKFLNYLECANKNIREIGNNWQGCAQATGISASEIETCAKGEEGKKLLKENIKRGEELKVQSSPTYYLNNKLYTGGRDEKSVTRALCALIPENKACKSIPPEPEVKLTLINDKDCGLCDSAGILAQLQTIFYNLSANEISYNSAQGKALISKFSITSVPAFVFDSSIEKHEVFEKIKNYLVEKNSQYLLMTQGTKFISREEIPGKIDLFVMSQCPYGNLAEQSMADVLKAMPSLKFNLHFIAAENNGTFASLHGQEEVSEDLRQLCVIKNYPKNFMDYVLCISENYTNANNIWGNCAEKNKMSTQKIESCANGEEGRKLLSEDVKLGEELRVSASPTFLANNQIVFNALTAQDIQSNICSINKNMSGCENVITTEKTQASASAGAGCGV